MMTEKDKLFFFSLFIFLLAGIEVQGSHHHHHHRHRRQNLQLQKLFVFGDSYADTGNIRKLLANSWKEPYGITFPGKPSGRFSDGRVFTDYLASFMGIRSPIPYRWKDIGPKPLRHGMNFAYGGTGVFNTLVPFPNMTTQIDLFQQLIERGVYTKWDLQYSMAHVSVAGNDYTAYQARNGSIAGIQDFITSLINQLTLDLKRITDLGIKKISVTGLEPIGCLPQVTVTSSYQKCDDTFNQAANFHNLLLENAVKDLNTNGNGSTIMILNLYKVFDSIIKSPGNQGRWKFENPLTPCCKGVSSAFSCGNLDGNGTKMYTVCERPESAFFWDGVHPSQTGWAAISSSLKTALYNLSS
ncbi:GDSL esterase/lipase At5g03610-like [Magnolia sinica]|uniref:GDSL esterase/lipase At5g03610-like n=1 Tax=Magnolia sinica TaxID=86752 RepID=UPI00265A537C|nr:GDSL esterase/lipase At5g03610-like [Magnolia sinica]